MVQVDVFWSYAMGAGFAACAARQLKNKKNPFDNKYFAYTAFFMGCLFAPSGAWLLWNYPQWETMQVATSHQSIPGWLVYLFGITNVSQGVLGYWVSYTLIRKGRLYAAHLNYVIGYFLFAFILLFGWDGTGWKRFLYDPTEHGGTLWTPETPVSVLAFITSNVALTLLIMGVPVIIFMGEPMVRWIRDGAADDPEVPEAQAPKEVQIIAAILASVFVASLGPALISMVFVYFIAKASGSMAVGFAVGLPLGIGLCWFFLFKENRPFYKIFQVLFIKETNPAA